MNGMINCKIFSAALFLMIGISVNPTRADACVTIYEPMNDIASRQLINNCPFPVVVSYCQGSGCDTGTPFQHLGRGQGIFMPRGHIRWNWCNERLFKEKRQCR